MAKKQPQGKLSLEEGAAYLKQRFGGRLVPRLEGLAYRFTIWLPVQSGGKPVFTRQQQAITYDLLLTCCDGCSQTTLEGFPPWTGSWLPEIGEQPISDQHILLIVYTLQDADAATCLRHLKWLLQQHHIAAQQVVLFEQVPVNLLESLAIAD